MLVRLARPFFTVINAPGKARPMVQQLKVRARSDGELARQVAHQPMPCRVNAFDHSLIVVFLALSSGD
jgi:hypothetical protein